MGTENIRVNAIAPGVVLSERVRRSSCAKTTRLKKSILGASEPEDVAPMALYLASDESRKVTGAILPMEAAPARSDRPLRPRPRQRALGGGPESLDLVAHALDLVVRQQRRPAERQRIVVLAGQGLDLHRKPERPPRGPAGRDHAVMRQQAGASPLERVERIGRTARACRRWHRARSGSSAPGRRDHVVEGRDVAARDRERGRRRSGGRGRSRRPPAAR